MTPSLSERNFIPSSRPDPSLSRGLPGAAPLPHTLHGHVVVGGAAAVVKVHVASAARALPARSFTRGSVLPPLTRAVYVTPAARDAVGSSVAVNEPAL